MWQTSLMDFCTKQPVTEDLPICMHQSILDFATQATAMLSHLFFPVSQLNRWCHDDDAEGGTGIDAGVETGLENAWIAAVTAGVTAGDSIAFRWVVRQQNSVKSIQNSIETNEQSTQRCRTEEFQAWFFARGECWELVSRHTDALFSLCGASNRSWFQPSPQHCCVWNELRATLDWTDWNVQRVTDSDSAQMFLICCPVIMTIHLFTIRFPELYKSPHDGIINTILPLEVLPVHQGVLTLSKPALSGMSSIPPTLLDSYFHVHFMTQWQI